MALHRRSLRTGDAGLRHPPSRPGFCVFERDAATFPPAGLDAGRVFDYSKLYLVCSVHGALYAPRHRALPGGRCQGKASSRCRWKSAAAPSISSYPKKMDTQQALKIPLGSQTLEKLALCRPGRATGVAGVFLQVPGLRRHLPGRPGRPWSIGHHASPRGTKHTALVHLQG